jgi:hypothetical protein
MDHAQITLFVDLLVNGRSIGIDVRHPELATAIVALLGGMTPRNGYEALHDHTKGAALATLLREVADGLVGVEESSLRDALLAIFAADDEGDGHALIHALRDARKLLGSDAGDGDGNATRLSPADSARFVESLLNPPEPNDALKAAAERFRGAAELDRIVVINADLLAALKAMMTGSVFDGPHQFGDLIIPARWSTIRMPTAEALDLARTAIAAAGAAL